MSTILLTGATGRIGTVLRGGLARADRTLRLFDRVEPRALGPREHAFVGDVRNLDEVLAAAKNAQTIVHLAGLPDEAPFGAILEHNILGTYNVFEAARQQSVRRVVFASSNHVVGFYPREHALSPDVPLRPDTYYGVSKVFGESLGRLYHDKWQLEVVCLRIGSFRERPGNTRQLSTWLSHRDAVHLVDRSIEARDVGFITLFGVSANYRSWWRNGAAASSLGFAPDDDAETFAGDVADSTEEPICSRLQGGEFARPDYGGGLG